MVNYQVKVFLLNLLLDCALALPVEMNGESAREASNKLQNGKPNDVVAYLLIIAHLALDEEKSHMINMSFSLRSETNKERTKIIYRIRKSLDLYVVESS
jgi:hypothetical protein